MSEDILDVIDGALRDSTVSGDAMRWHPEPGAPEGAAGDGRPVSLTIDTTGFVEAMQQVAGVLSRLFADFADFAKAFGPTFAVLAAHNHPPRELARCRVCNPGANPPPLAVNGHEYTRRQRARRRGRRN